MKTFGPVLGTYTLAELRSVLYFAEVLHCLSVVAVCTKVFYAYGCECNIKVSALHHCPGAGARGCPGARSRPGDRRLLCLMQQTLGDAGKMPMVGVMSDITPWGRWDIQWLPQAACFEERVGHKLRGNDHFCICVHGLWMLGRGQ